MNVIVTMNKDDYVSTVKNLVISGGGIGGFAFYGEARLSLKGGGAAVPEPSTYGLIGAGFLVALVFLRRRNTGKRG